MIRINDNFHSGRLEQHGAGEKLFALPAADMKKELRLDFAAFRANTADKGFYSFFIDPDKKAGRNDDADLIVSVAAGRTGATGGSPVIESGNYIGRFRHDGVDFDIRSRFGDVFLLRMLNFVNDIYLDDIDLFGDNSASDGSLDYSRLIIYYLFAQSLEKAFLLGLPKAYASVRHHESAVRGRIDINEFVRRDVPYVGKVSSISREQKEIQPIIDVLAKAINVMERSEAGSTAGGKKAPEKVAAGVKLSRHVANIRSHLNEKKSNAYVSNETIGAAIGAKALRNPIFSPYKKVLGYAEMIIKADRIRENNVGKVENYGFLVNVAELFEIYITKLLQRGFPQWTVSSPKIELYENKFYARKIIPDIVMERDNDVLVFDTKYKSMKFRDRHRYGGDLDRGDFFQINTYMNYYHRQGRNVVCGGLLYPLGAPLNLDSAYAQDWLDGAEGSRTWFVVDGVFPPSYTLDPEAAMDALRHSEDSFIERMKNIIEAVAIAQ